MGGEEHPLSGAEQAARERAGSDWVEGAALMRARADAAASAAALLEQLVAYLGLPLAFQDHETVKVATEAVRSLSREASGSLAEGIEEFFASLREFFPKAPA